MKEQVLNFELNGEIVETYADPSWSLLRLLRSHFNLIGAREGCGKGECGTCTVLLDGKAVNSCLVPAGKVEKRRVLTIEGVTREGLSRGAKVHPLQAAFVEKGAVQCGFCTPGMIMSAYAVLKDNPSPSPKQVREAISGNLCRCSGYKQIEEAVLDTAKTMLGKQGNRQQSLNKPYR